MYAQFSKAAVRRAGVPLQRGVWNLRVRDHADHLAVLFHALNLLLSILGLVRLFLGILGERLLRLRLVPVLVEVAAELVGEVLGPHSGERAKAARSANVANKAHNHHRRRLNDGHSLNSLLLVLLGARLVDITHNVGHARLVAHERGEVARLRLVVAGELPNPAPVPGCALAGHETQGAVPGPFELPVRHDTCCSTGWIREIRPGTCGGSHRGAISPQITSEAEIETLPMPLLTLDGPAARAGTAGAVQAPAYRSEDENGTRGIRKKCAWSHCSRAI